VKKAILVLVVARARADEVKRQMDEKMRDFFLAASDRIVLVATNMVRGNDAGVWCKHGANRNTEAVWEACCCSKSKIALQEDRFMMFSSL